LSLELSPTSLVHDLLLIHSNVVDAVLLKLLSVVCVSNEQDLESSSDIDKLLEVAGADLNKSGEHEEVSVDHQLDEELSILFLDVEVIRVDILDYACEVRLGNAFNLDNTLVLLLALFEVVLVREHASEVVASVG
jgi:hypothetical protein